MTCSNRIKECTCEHITGAVGIDRLDGVGRDINQLAGESTLRILVADGFNLAVPVYQSNRFARHAERLTKRSARGGIRCKQVNIKQIYNDELIDQLYFVKFI